MYSSTVSTATTIQADQCSDSFSVWQKKLEEYSRTRKYFEPEKIIDENCIFNLFKKPILLQEPTETSQQSTTDNGPICKIHDKFEDDIIKFWSQNYYSKDTSTFLDKILNKNPKEGYINFLSNFKERNIPWYIDNRVATEEMPYVERFYCYPKFMASLGHNVVHHKKILEYIDCGIRFFHLDCRFGPMRMHSKSFQYLNYARKYLLRRSYGEAIFGTAVEITGRNLITGLVRNNQKICIECDSSVILTADRNYSHKCNHRIIYVNFFDYIENLKLQDIIELGDNNIKLEIIYFLNDSIECKVIREGLLESNTQVILPLQYSLKLPINITHEEEEDIYNAFELGCEFLICPCVYYAHLIQRIRWLMAARNRDIKIIARINLTKTILKAQINFIMKFCQGVWLETSNIRDENQKMFEILIRDCFHKNKIIIRSGAIITDNLSNLSSDEIKMKNIFLYPDCLAVSVDLINVRQLKSIISRAYPQMNAENLKLSCSSITAKESNTIDSIFVRHLITSCLAIRATCVIVVNNNGKAVLSIAQQRPLVPIIASFCHRSIARTASVLRNVYPVIYYSPFPTSRSEELGFRLNYSIQLGKMIGCISRHEPFLFVFESKEGLSFTDTYRLLFLDDLN